MEIILLGTGTAIPAEKHTPAGLVVLTGKAALLVDAGPGTISRLAKAGMSYNDLDSLLFSHLHPDHTLDLATLMQIFDSAPDDRRTRAFQIIGCRGTESFYKKLLDLYPVITPETYVIKIREVLRDKFMAGGLKVDCLPTVHTPDSVAYRFEQDGKSLVYSGDATAQGDLDQLCKGADLLISECSYPSGWNTPDHMNADGLGRLAQNAGVKKLVVVHRYPPALDVDLKSQIAMYYSGEIIMAEDGMRITI